MLAGLLALLAACTGTSDFFNTAPPAAQQPITPIGTGQVKVGLILPMSAAGNAGAVAQSMKNAAEMALAEFNSPNIQLLLKDDGGSAQGAAQAAQEVLQEGAEIILGPLFAHSVGAVGQAARQRGVPVIAFSTDANVAARGVYLLSFLPETEVNRIISYSIGTGKRSFAAMMPDNAYGSVAEAAFKQVVAGPRAPRGGGGRE
jgi:ABC-type branched-subunit amino acid transport system substrate-binding protein